MCAVCVNIFSSTDYVFLCILYSIKDCWNNEVASHGAEKASVVRAIFRMIRDRFILVLTLSILFNSISIVRVVSENL